MRRVLLSGVALLWFASTAHAQAPIDPSAHWVGVVNTPTSQLDVEVAAARSSAGAFSGTVTMPGQRLVGLPLHQIDIDGASITFAARTDQRFVGIVAPDGQTLYGDLSFQGYAFPFTLMRMGPPRIEPPPVLGSVSKDLEGTWVGTVTAGGSEMHVVLKLENRSDNTSRGSLTNLDEGSLELPIAALTETTTSVTVGFNVVEATYVGEFSSDRRALAGTWSQGGASVPLTLHHDATRP